MLNATTPRRVGLDYSSVQEDTDQSKGGMLKTREIGPSEPAFVACLDAESWTFPFCNKHDDIDLICTHSRAQASTLSSLQAPTQGTNLLQTAPAAERAVGCVGRAWNDRYRVSMLENSV